MAINKITLKRRTFQMSWPTMSNGSLNDNELWENLVQACPKIITIFTFGWHKWPTRRYVWPFWLLPLWYVASWQHTNFLVRSHFHGYFFLIFFYFLCFHLVLFCSILFKHLSGKGTGTNFKSNIKEQTSCKLFSYQRSRRHQVNSTFSLRLSERVTQNRFQISWINIAIFNSVIFITELSQSIPFSEIPLDWRRMIRFGSVRLSAGGVVRIIGFYCSCESYGKLPTAWYLRFTAVLYVLFGAIFEIICFGLPQNRR